MADRNRRAAAPKPRKVTERAVTGVMKQKLALLAIFVVLAFVGLSIRLVSIVRDNGAAYEKQVLSQQRYDSVTLPFKRGDITDSNGTLLATSEKVYDLVIDAKAMSRDDKKYIDPTMSALSRCFDVNETELRRYVDQNPDSQYKVVLKLLTYDEIRPFLELQNAPEDGADIQGVWFEEEYKRYYPNSSLACDVIGFVGSDNNGTYGLEEFYNNTLNGTNGREYGFLNDDSMLERTIKPAVDGYSLVTTIDANVQSIVEKHLAAFNEQYQNNAREGLGANNLGCIVMDVNSGNVLAMASYPTFDLNDPKNLEGLYSPEEIAEFEANDTTYDEYNRLWRNFCISDTYEPGSTMKPFTVAAALDAGAITGNESYVCNGNREIGGHKIKCHNTYGDGPITVKESVEKSCNVGLMYIAEALGIPRFCEYQRNFNFGLKTNVDLAGESRTASLLYDKNSMGPTELATNSFGQSFNVTMIQMITGFCSLINGGNYYEPHLVSRILSGDGSTVKTIEPRVLKQTVSPSVSKKIIEYCNAVVETGTGKTARPAGYRIGGKTGTAETLPRGNREYVVSFMGYAPADEPQVAIYVVVDRPNVQLQDDAKFATRIVRAILTEALPYLNIYMTEELSDSEREELDALHIKIAEEYKEKIADADQKLPDGVADNPGEELESNEVQGGNLQNPENQGQTVPDGEKTADSENSGEDQTQKDIWKTFEKDPQTGNYVDPNTGHQIDPETGYDLSGETTMEDLPGPPSGNHSEDSPE